MKVVKGSRQAVFVESETLGWKYFPGERPKSATFASAGDFISAPAGLRRAA